MGPEEIVIQTIKRIMEKWTTLEIHPVRSDWSRFDSTEPVVVATVQFHGPFDGTCKVMAQRSFMQLLVQRLFEDSAELPERELLDATKELSNVLAGNLLTELYGIDSVFSLEPPSLTCAEVAQLATQKDRRRVFFMCDDCPMGFTFAIE